MDTRPEIRLPGFFLSLDGPDGGGKTTQVAQLSAWLGSLGREVVTCRDPGGTPLGNQLRSILLDRSKVEISPRAEMLLYMASRAQLVAETIRPALERGAFVLSDRYLLANIAYQGYAGGIPIAEVAEVGRAATGGIFPDLTIILDVPPDVARDRTGGARDRIEDRPASYHARVREGFLNADRDRKAGLFSYDSGPIVVMDASADPASVSAQIRSEVERALANGPRS
ncbi:dTMP kinase [Singulisphaera sp. PoT]|uniref:dTMP kinase n=1 Tax=Singulisphaera sp. PoT TaxID=3411797 RepID=UPI003BF4B964